MLTQVSVLLQPYLARLQKDFTKHQGTEFHNITVKGTLAPASF